MKRTFCIGVSVVAMLGACTTSVEPEGSEAVGDQPGFTSSNGLPSAENASLLMLSPEEQVKYYPAIETVYAVNTIEAGDYVRELPVSDTSIAPTWEHGDQSWTVESFMDANRASGVVVMKGGKIVLEKYGLGREKDDRWTSFSVAKSVTSTLVGAAIQDGKIKSLNDPVTDYIADLKGSEYEGVTVRQLLMMASGVKWNEDYTDPNSDVAQAGFKYREPGVNPLVSYMRRLPRESARGETFLYKTGETDLAGVLVSSAVGKSLSEYASEKLWKPFGMEQDGIWVLDSAGHERGGCCMSMTLRDYARIGQFMLEDGVAQGTRILPEGWVAEATSAQITNGGPPEGYGYFWWMLPEVFGGGYAAYGIFGQSIILYPEHDIVIAINSAWEQPTGREYGVSRLAFANAARLALIGGTE